MCLCQFVKNGRLYLVEFPIFKIQCVFPFIQIIFDLFHQHFIVFSRQVLYTFCQIYIHFSLSLSFKMLQMELYFDFGVSISLLACRYITYFYVDLVSCKIAKLSYWFQECFFLGSLEISTKTIMSYANKSFQKEVMHIAFIYF